MPRVSEKHRQARRAQIVDAALRCFRAKGIAETRMRDIFAESGLSAGAVYNHFPAKRDLLHHLAEESRGRWTTMFADLHKETEDRPGQNLQRLMEQLLDGLADPVMVADIGSDLGMWAFSIHQPDLRAACGDLFRTVAEGFDNLLPRAREGAENPAVGAHLLACLQGLGLQAALGVAVDIQGEKERVGIIIEHARERNI